MSKLQYKRKSNRTPSKHTHFREMKSVLFTEHRIAKAFKDFTKSQILPLIQLDGYKLAQKQKTALNCIHNLALANLRNKVVADDRNNATNSLRIAIWDAIIKAGLCRVCKGKQSVGLISRYRATGKLVKLFKTYGESTYIDFGLAYNTNRKRPTKNAFVYLHTGTIDLNSGKRLPKEQRKKILPLIDFPPNIIRNLAEIEARLHECNRINSNHSWLVDCPENERLQMPYEPNYCLKQSHSGRIGRYTRLVGWTDISIQQFSKKERRRILIDDEETTELDYGEFDIRRHYHFAGLNPSGDAYKPELIFPEWYDSPASTVKKKKIARKLIKRCTNALLNVSSEKQGIRAIGMIIHKWPKKCKALLWDIFYNYEDMYVSAPTLLKERILQVHSEIENVFCCNQGETMMSLGASMMFDIRWIFSQKNKPCYCIHDSILCRRSDRSFAKKRMKSVYRKWIPNGFDPVVNIEF